MPYLRRSNAGMFKYIAYLLYYLTVTCRHRMAHLLLSDDQDGLQTWRFEVTGFILNK